MIKLTEINALAKEFGVPAETIEKDYVISWILLSLANSKLMNDCIFYGGTAIKRIFFEEHRFSEDIDLQSNKRFSKEYILNEFDSLQYAKEQANLSLQIDTDNIIANHDRMQLFINYSGYEEITGAPKEVRVDFIMDMMPFGVLEKKKVICSYSDLPEKMRPLTVMSLNTILANKLGLLLEITRNEPRDLFDIWFLLERTGRFDFSTEVIVKTFKEKYGYNLHADIIITKLKSASYKKRWDERLGKQVAELPNIEHVTKRIIANLEKLFVSHM